MTIQLRLYDDGNTEAALPLGVVGGNVGGWHIETAPVQAQSLMPHSATDGPAVHERVRDLVSERIDVWIREQPSAAALRDKVQAIERLLERANAGNTVWLEYDTGEASDNLWRSPVKAGMLGFGPDMRLRWQQRQAQLQLNVTREPWWEAYSSDMVMLGQGATLMDVVGSAVVSNGGQVTARAANAVGVLPAPLALKMTLPSASESGLRIYVGQRNDASNDAAGSYTLAAISSPMALSGATETLEKLVVSEAMQGWWRVIVESTGTSSQRAADRTANLWLRAALGDASEQIEKGSWSRAGYFAGRESRYTDLGPLYVNRSHLWLLGYAEALTPSSLRVHLLPVDGFRAYHIAGDSAASGELIDTDGELSGLGAKTASAEGEALLLTPGRASELVFLTETAAGEAAGQMSVAAEVRPRRLTI